MLAYSLFAGTCCCHNQLTNQSPTNTFRVIVQAAAHTDSAQASAHVMVEAFLNTTFCAIPHGSTLAARMLANVVVFGCVPVLFVEDQLTWNLQLSKHALKSMAILVKPTHLLHSSSSGSEPLNEVLQHIPDSIIKEKRAAATKHVHQLVLTTETTEEEDALTSLLAHVARST